MSPSFSSEHYQKLMDGLEAVEKNYKEIWANTARIDAEYFKKADLRLLNKLKSLSLKKLSDMFYITDGIHASINYDPNSSVHLLSATSPRKGFVNVDRDVRISLKQHKANPRTALREKDVLISTAGTIGNVAMVTSDILPSNSDRHVAILRARGKNVFAECMTVFLMSKYGKTQCLRETSGNVQQNLFLYMIRDLWVPEFSPCFESKVTTLFKEANRHRIESQQTYREAQAILLKYLDIPYHYHLSNAPISIRALRESFLKTGRLDAEYYQPKYDSLIQAIRSYHNGYAQFADVFNLRDQNVVPKPNQEYQYIELANVGSLGQINDITKALGKELPSRARRMVKTNDVILSSIEGSMNSIALIPKEYNNALCSTGFYVLNSETLKPEVTLILFQSLFMQDLLKRGCSGTILTSLNRNDLFNIPIPILDGEIQNKISSYVQESMRYRQQAKELLHLATESVELAIDKSEDDAVVMLTDRQTDRQTLIATYNQKAMYYWRLAIFYFLEELGCFANLQEQQCNYVVKNFSETFRASGRLDSEYYQTKYDKLFVQLGRLNSKKLSHLVRIQKSIEPGSAAYMEKGIPFVRVQDLSSQGISEPCIYLDQKSCAEAPRPQKDTILFSKDGTVGIAYKVQENDPEFVTSSAILHLNMKTDEMLPDYLTLMLNSPIVQLQAERDAGGSVINHWKLSEIADVLVPVLSYEQQKEISLLAQSSFRYRTISKQYLEIATRAVEVAIEQNEDAAICYIEDCENLLV